MTSRRRRWIFGAFLAGLVLRLWALPLWGTFDTEVQKAWSARAATSGVGDIYGPSDREILRSAHARGVSTWKEWLHPSSGPKTFEWGHATYFVDYPPGSVLVLAAVGRLYASFSPTLANRPLFNVMINLAPLAGSAAIAWLLFRSSSAHGVERSLAFWLNPATLLAAPILGYQDTIFGAFALFALMALQHKSWAAASAATVTSCLIKPQAVLLLPIFFICVLRGDRRRAFTRTAVAGALSAIVLLSPWWGQGHLLSALEGASRTWNQGTLSAQGLNVWWIAGAAHQSAQAGPGSLTTVESIDAFRDWSGWDPRVPARLAVMATVLFIAITGLRTTAPPVEWLPLALVAQVHSYALLATSVHENHTLLALFAAPLLLGCWQRARLLYAGTSLLAFANLFLFAGLGRRITSQRTLETLRHASGIDMTVLVAIGHIVFSMWLLFAFWGAVRARRPMLRCAG